MFQKFILILFIPWLLSSSQKKKRVVFFGDSITELAVKPWGFISLLDSIANSANSKFEFLGAGVSSDKIYDLYLRMEKDVMSKAPQVVVIFIGVNDVWHKTLLGTGTDANKFTRFYQAVIDKLTAKKIKIILATPAAIGEKTSGNPLDNELDKYCELVLDLAVKNKLALVDLRKQFRAYNKIHNTEDKYSGILTYDGVHLNDEGNKLVAGEMWKALK
ncbi:MAG TPA: GDSL-type esterase/lipase family protein [Ferruginibacter sp.]|nr:GDSL-type esterase/lipase family protein [Ferruginibacter sp.]